MIVIIIVVVEEAVVVVVVVVVVIMISGRPFTGFSLCAAFIPRIKLGVYNSISLFPHSSLYTLRCRPKGCFPKPFIVRTLSLSNKIYIYTHTIYAACVFFSSSVVQRTNADGYTQNVYAQQHARVYYIHVIVSRKTLSIYSRTPSRKSLLRWEWFPSDCQWWRGMSCAVHGVYLFSFLRAQYPQFGVIVSFSIEGARSWK